MTLILRCFLKREQYYYLCLIDTFRSTKEILEKTGTMKAFTDKIYQKQRQEKNIS